MKKLVTPQNPKPDAKQADLPNIEVSQHALAVAPGGIHALAELQAAEWNATNESIGSFADQHSTL